ncbi:hypothetical protein J2S19_002695 [Metabacillus malikii]|uniref:Uncharacterized protein n=1 Tax=Metabacillus malikii TaxID=1504265 RepID=A0ABT9ZHY7_9BACI|nr:hypothetical protein [Metabacillus malikii]
MKPKIVKELGETRFIGVMKPKKVKEFRRNPLHRCDETEKSEGI